MNNTNDFLMHADDPNESIDLRDLVDPVEEEEEDVRAILIEDLEPTSPTFGAMSLGSLGFQIASERTGDDADWKWTTFGNARGFNADLITAGTLNAININGSNISGGTITGTNINNGGGTFKVDGDGMLTAFSATISGSISGSTISGSTVTGGFIRGSEISGGRISATSQTGTVVLTSDMTAGYTTYTQTDTADPTNPDKNSITTIGKHGVSTRFGQRMTGIYPTSLQVYNDYQGSVAPPTQYTSVYPMYFVQQNGVDSIQMMCATNTGAQINLGGSTNRSAVTSKSVSIYSQSTDTYGMFYIDNNDAPNLSLRAANGTYTRVDNDEIWLYKSDGNYTRITNDNIYIYRNNSLAWKAI